MDYIEEIARIISDVETVDQDLIKHIFITNDDNKIDQISRLKKFNISMKVFDLEVNQFIGNFANSVISELPDKSGIFVPAITASNETDILDASHIYDKLLNNKISIVHTSIGQLTTSLTDMNIPPFFQGETITWQYLAINLEAVRFKYEELLNKVVAHLETAKNPLNSNCFINLELVNRLWRAE